MDSPLLNRICEKLHDLYVIECPDLTTILHSTTLSFNYLKELYISDCHGLKYLFTSSATKMLMHLENIKVWNCNSIQTIVAKEQDERTSRGIKLVRLNHIDLSNLESLECFYSGNNNLQLPSLIQADIWDCPKMKIFCPGSILANSFKGIKASNLVFYDDLNSSVKKLFLLKVTTSAESNNYDSNFSVDLMSYKLALSKHLLSFDSLWNWTSTYLFRLIGQSKLTKKYVEAKNTVKLNEQNKKRE